jgi:glycosyltransferase involved in cell wall biosynthesis
MTIRATSLHVAALPFPSPQGTQAAIRFMMEALERSGERAELLTYAHGEGAVSFSHHRARSLVTDHSLRSGPSLAKVANDLALAGALASHPSEHIVAHHVEAAAIARFARRPWVFVAHTDLEAELPTYLASRWGSIARRAGAACDRSLGRAAGALAAVSPLLASSLADRCARPVHALPIPWPVPPAMDADERARARRALGLADDTPTLLYAGNLDGYQGLDVLWRALAHSKPKVRMLVATADPRAVALDASATVLPLASEANRRVAHGAADVVVVPRRSPGGLPVKLLDALSRGSLTVTVPRALAGHAIAPLVCAARDDDHEALARAIDEALGASLERRAELAAAARSYVAEMHSDARLLSALAAAHREACAGALR